MISQQIRPATSEDTAALRALMTRSNGYERPEARVMVNAYAATWSPASALEVWTAVEGEGLVGFYALITHADDLELDLFFTANDSQGTGLGRRLFEHMAERAKALGATKVVISSNPEAAGFYRRMGAVDIGVSPPGDGISWERPKFALYL